jgi:glutamate transport system substrate-binding protein
VRRPLRLTRRVALLAAAVIITGAGCSADGGLSEPANGASDFVAAVQQAADLPTSPVLDRIGENGKLVVGTPEDVNGFNFLNPLTGEYTGFEADLAQMLARYILGEPKVEHVTVTTDTREALLQNGTVDAVLSTYQITPERLAKIDFAGPHMELGTGIVKLAGSDLEIREPADLAGKRVITTAGAAADFLARFAPDAQPVIFDSLQSCVLALQDGRGDVLLNNEAVTIGLVAENENLVLVDGSFEPALFGIGTSQSDPVFTEVVNDFLIEIERDGLWEQAWDHNVGSITGRPAPEPPAVGQFTLN